MAAVSETKASLRIFGDDLDPDEISVLLGAAPTSSARKGEAPSAGEASSEPRARADGRFKPLLVDRATSTARLLNCFRG